MVNHHPNSNLLMEYVSGSLDLASSIAVKAHLHFCSKCAHHVAQLEHLGGECLSDAEPQQMDDNFDDLMIKIEGLVDTTRSKLASDTVLNVPLVETKTTHASHYYKLPKVIQRLVPRFSELRWSKLNSSLSVARLVTGQKTHEVALHRIAAGGKVPSHGHKGNELTVVLKGSFSDEDGVYQQGDFISLGKDHQHRPMAAKNEDCLCLSVLDAPVSLTGFFGRLLNPFLKTHAA